MPGLVLGVRHISVLAGLLSAAAVLVVVAFAGSDRPALAFRLPSEAQVSRWEKLRAERARFVLGVPRARLESIAECESHGDPEAIGGGGAYRGKYQFDTGTWKSIGGEGDPVKAPEREQDLRAAMLLKRSGESAWPACA